MAVSNYERQLYTAVLGKVIGVYLGRPFEHWSKASIQEKWGAIDHYVHEDCGVPLVVPDDDISGTFTFVRALIDSGLLEKTPSDFYGDTWLNYLIENKTILWWGGMALSTEHTAYLRLKQGVRSPESGSMHINGKEVAEQIGAQIFIDAFGMVAPDNPELAVRLAKNAASVSHDGEAVYAAQVVAAMVSMAFTEKRMDVLLDRAVQYIPSDSLIAQVHRDVRKWAKEFSDWNDTFEQIQKKYGYEIYGGICHVVPNHALMVMAWAYAQNDFFKALSIVCTAGWDTDCNGGNVGTVSALVAGLEHLNDKYEFQMPFADRLYLATADGTDSVTDVLRLSEKVAAIGRKIMHWPAVAAPKHNAHFHFEMPGALHGFLPRDNGSQGDKNASIKNIPAPEGFDGTRCMEYSFHCENGVSSMVETPLARSGSGVYTLMSTPIIGGGTTIRIKGKVLAPAEAKLRLYLSIHNDAMVYSEDIPRTADGAVDFEWVPETTGMVESLGVEAYSDKCCEGVFLIDSIDFSGKRKLYAASTEDDFGWISSMDRNFRKASNDFTENMRNFGRSGELGVFVTGNQYHGNTEMRCKFRIHSADRSGLLLHYQGLSRWIGLLFTRNSLQIVRNHYGEKVLAEIPFVYEENKVMDLCARTENGRISLSVDGKVLIAAEDHTSTAGGAGMFLEHGVAGMCDITLTEEILPWTQM